MMASNLRKAMRKYIPEDISKAVKQGFSALITTGLKVKV